MVQRTAAGIAYDRAGPRGSPTVVLVHAGVADRRMWDPQWPALITQFDAVRLDLRGYGDSTTRPRDAQSPVDDVVDTLSCLGVERCAMVGASFGAGVAVEVALTRPALVGSLLLVAPGGSLIAEATPALRAFFDAESAALDADDVNAAVEANLAYWVEGPSRASGDVAPGVRASVGAMQRRAFEITAGWDDVEENEIEPSALERLADITAPTLVLLGDLDLAAIHDAAARVVAGIPGARRVDWPDVVHLPSMERPSDFLFLLQRWLADHDSRG